MTTKPKPTTKLVVIELATQKDVHTVSVAGKTERQIERCLEGMLINMDTDRFAVEERSD